MSLSSSAARDRRKTMSRRSAEFIGMTTPSPSPSLASHGQNFIKSGSTTKSKTPAPPAQGIAITPLSRAGTRAPIRPKVLQEIEQDFCATGDLGELKELTLENVVQCLVTRYQSGIYYTYADSMLISLNPCTPFSRKSMTNFSTSTPIFGSRVEIGGGAGGGDAQNYSYPHVLSVANQCLRHLYLTGIPQVIIVTGNSGAGKTTATQQILCHLIDKNDEGSPKNFCEELSLNSLDKQIYLGTLVLEALGNAGTVTNPNSSRFGRFVQLNYDSKSGKILGASIRTCLLEKHRVSKCNPHERNFHIFYYLLAGISQTQFKLPAVFEDLKLSDLDLIPSAFLSSLKKSDEEDFKTLYRSIQSLVLELEFNNIFKILIGILIMLNVKFEEEKVSESSSSTEDGCGTGTRNFIPVDMNHILQASELFGLNPQELRNILVSRTIKVSRNLRRRESIFRKPCGSVEECSSRLSSMLSKLYDTIFHFVLQKINKILEDVNSPSSTTITCKSATTKISLLDLYGFENLGIENGNQFEQLCINYANERLHLVQVQNIKSGNLGNTLLELVQIESDSESRLSSIHDPVFSVLNEACLLNRGSSDEDIHDTLASYCGKNKWIKCNSRRAKEPLQFTICHYAGEVRYDLGGMLNKNMDYIPPELNDIFETSSNEFIKILMRTSNLDDLELGSVRSKGIKKKTILKKFKSAVDELVEELSGSSQSLRFIRCLRPNDNLAQGKIQAEIIQSQLYSSGIVDIIRIAGNGFPIRITKKQFEQKFPTIIQKFCDGLLVSTSQIQDSNLLSSANLKVDQRKVYFTENGWKFIKKVEEFMFRNSVSRIQRLWRTILEAKYKKATADAELQAVSPSISEEDEGIAINEDSEIPMSSADNSRRNSIACDSLIDGTCEGGIEDFGSEATVTTTGTTKESLTAQNHVTPLPSQPRTTETEFKARIFKKLDWNVGDGIVTIRFVEKFPVYFPTRPTPLPFAQYAPRTKGLNQIFTLMD